MARLLNAPRLVLSACFLSGLVACSYSSRLIQEQRPSAALDGTHIYSSRSLLAAARVERHAGNTPQAARLLHDLLHQRPSYVGAHVELVSMQLEVGNLMRARAALDAGLAVAPDDLQLLRLDGNYHLASGDLVAAHARYLRVTEESPQSPLAARNLALVLVMQDKPEAAEETLRIHLDAQRADAALRAMFALRARSAQRPAWKTRAPKAEPETPAEESLSMVVGSDVSPEPTVRTLVVTDEAAQESGRPTPEPSMEPSVESTPAAPAQEPPALPAETRPSTQEQAPVYRSADWHGIPQDRLERHGRLLVQRSPWVRVQFSVGRHLTVSVGPDAKTGAWVLGPEFDYRLEPGSRVHFNQDGSFFAGSGEREEQPAPEGRPAAELVWP